MSQRTPNRMAEILKWVSGFKVPKDLGGIQIPWEKFKIEPDMRVSTEALRFRPCEALAYDEKFDGQVSHHDVIIGAFDHSGFSSGWAVGSALQAKDYNRMQAVMEPNLAPPIRTLILPKVAVDSMSRTLDMWGTLQEALACAVTDAYSNGLFPEGIELSHGVMVGVFELPGLAKDLKKASEIAKHKHALYALAYVGLLVALYDGLTGGLEPTERVERRKNAKHLYRGFDWGQVPQDEPTATE